MTASDQRTETWKQIPGASYYEASDRGRIRSVDRTVKGRFWPGVVLKPREDGDGYLVVNITYDNGERKHGVSVARLVLTAHDKPCPPGMEVCHGPGGQKDNTYPENLRWDTEQANQADWRRDNPPKPKPQKRCIICDEEFAGNGRRCRPCIVKLGVTAAQLLRSGVELERVAAQLEYPHQSGLLTYAQRHGGYGQSWLRSVRTRLGSWLAGGNPP